MARSRLLASSYAAPSEAVAVVSVALDDPLEHGDRARELVTLAMPGEIAHELRRIRLLLERLDLGGRLRQVVLL
jgi:hypothetical protein